MLDDVEVTWALLNCVFVRHLKTYLSFGQCVLLKENCYELLFMKVFASVGDVLLVNGVHGRTALCLLGAPVPCVP